MSGLKRYQLAAYVLGITAIVSLLWATSRPSTDSVPDQRLNGGLGSPEDAFKASGRAVKQYLEDHAGDPVTIDPEFRATMMSKSKIWTVKGYAFRPQDNKTYRWIVILNYHDMQEWEILAKIVTPEITPPGRSEADGAPKLQGKLFQTDPDDGR
jgi:hypothetical protein